MLCNFEFCITHFTLCLIPRPFWRWYWGGDDPPPWWHQSSELCQLSQVLTIHCNYWLLNSSENFSRQFHTSPNIAHRSVPNSIVSVVFPVSRLLTYYPAPMTQGSSYVKCFNTQRGWCRDTQTQLVCGWCGGPLTLASFSNCTRSAGCLPFILVCLRCRLTRF